MVQKADLEDATTPSLSFLFCKNRTKNGILKITEIVQKLRSREVGCRNS